MFVLFLLIKCLHGSVSKLSLILLNPVNRYLTEQFEGNMIYFDSQF